LQVTLSYTGVVSLAFTFMPNEYLTLTANTNKQIYALSRDIDDDTRSMI